jgi:uncharacterized protein YgiM (DUF1202 family)
MSFLMLCGFLTTEQVFANQAYSVKGVGKSDVLNVRKYPGYKSKIIATIPSNGTAIRLNKKEVYKGSSTWVQVQWQGKKGWVNDRYITPTSVASAEARASGSNQHTHPRNQCTRSISHRHPNGSKRHIHRYSCKKAAGPTPSNKNAHTHPKNKCTRSITHSHPNGKRTHIHRYSCQNKKKVARDPNAHTHPRNKCTRSITHTHPNGKRTHTHRYSCKAKKGRMSKDPNAHTHPKKKCTRSITHTHPNGKRKHVHRYSCK